jgi:alpha-ribazole phosphatase
VNRRLIYLVRHCRVEPDDGRQRFNGHTDVPLSERGMEQARGLERIFAGVELGAAFSSTLQRARVTAETAVASHGLPVTTHSGLREVNLGEWEGMTLDEVKQSYPDAFRAREADIAHYRIPGGESFADCARRAVPAFEEIVHNTRGDLLIVAHGGVNRTLLCHLLGLPLRFMFRLRQDYACINVIELGGFETKLLLMNAASLQKNER